MFSVHRVLLRTSPCYHQIVVTHPPTRLARLGMKDQPNTDNHPHKWFYPELTQKSAKLIHTLAKQYVEQMYMSQLIQNGQDGRLFTMHLLARSQNLQHLMRGQSLHLEDGRAHITWCSTILQTLSTGQHSILEREPEKWLPHSRKVAGVQITQS